MVPHITGQSTVPAGAKGLMSGTYALPNARAVVQLSGLPPTEGLEHMMAPTGWRTFFGCLAAALQ